MTCLAQLILNNRCYLLLTIVTFRGRMLTSCDKRDSRRRTACWNQRVKVRRFSGGLTEPASDGAGVPPQRLPALVFVLGDIQKERPQLARILEHAVTALLDSGHQPDPESTANPFVERGSHNGMVISAGEMTIDLRSHQAWWQDRLLPLTEQELRILAALGRNKGAVSFRELSEEVWGWRYDGDPDFIRSAVKRLRGKLKTVTAGERIETVRGYGFRLKV